jgi:hypothetical protein
VFGFAALSAVILNKAMSLIVVLTALPVRLVAIPYGELSPHWNVVVNLLAGSLSGLIHQRERLGQHDTVDGQVEPGDRIGEWFEDAVDLPRHTDSVLVFALSSKSNSTNPGAGLTANNMPGP